MQNRTIVTNKEDIEAFIKSWEIEKSIDVTTRRPVRNCTEDNCTYCMELLNKKVFSPCHRKVCTIILHNIDMFTTCLLCKNTHGIRKMRLYIAEDWIFVFLRARVLYSQMGSGQGGRTARSGRHATLPALPIQLGPHCCPFTVCYFFCALIFYVRYLYFSQPGSMRL